MSHQKHQEQQQQQQQQKSNLRFLLAEVFHIAI
jgi:hypothetical protein